MGTAYITDKQVMSILGISRATLGRIIDGKRCEGTVDLMSVKPVKVLGQRRWSVKKLSAVLGMPEGEIMEALS